MGATAWVLQQILALTPPTIWPPAVALGAIDHTDWPKLLLAGLAQAAEAYRDSEWCAELLVLWAWTTERQGQLPVDPAALFAALDPARAEAVLRRILEHDPALVGSLICARTEQWSEDFSRYIIGQLPALLAKQSNSLSTFLDTAFRLDPRVLPDAERLLKTTAEEIWSPTLMWLVRTLESRAAMRKEFDD